MDTTLHSLIPWFVVSGIALAGACFEALLYWNKHLRRAAVLRGASALYALALGISLAPFSYTGKNEIFEERLVSLLTILASMIVAERLIISGIASFARRHATAFSSVSLLVSLTRIVVLTIGGLVLLQSLGIAVTPIVTAFGVGGLAVALALQSTLSHLFAGIQIVAARQMRPGDCVKLEDGSEGYINDISWRTTTVRDLYNNIIVIPNGKLAGAMLTNYSLPDKRVLTAVNVTVRHGVPLAHAEELALDIARSVGKDPYVRFQGISDTGIALTAFFTVASFADQLTAKSLFVQRFYERSTREGMLLPSQPWAEMPAEAAVSA